MNRTHGVTQWRIFSGACLAALLVLPVRAAEPLPMGTLSGRVVNVVGQPVTGARVWMASSIKTLAEARSLRGGRYVRPDIAAEPLHEHAGHGAKLIA